MMPSLTIWWGYYAWGGDANAENPWGELFDITFTPPDDRR